MTPNRIRELFKQAVELPESQRGAFLDDACGDDAELRREVESLLVHAIADTTKAAGTHSSEAGTEYRAGDSIGPFKILSTLGEGGMGVVYLAEQTEPVRRRVALKVIKAGMDSKQVIARFEAERQALAIMRHPGIAQVYEAGSIEDGRPYFVMEYVEGQPITDACDAKHLDTTKRLQLMTEVCEAVQHAHQKGVIHRDLKPTNILVIRGDDDTLHPKIIDFGIAKATGQQLTNLTLLTQAGHFIGTPAYMSPEQADLNAMDIDTRSDVYSLGVVLYELLSGRPPFAPRSLHEAGLEEMRRIIREEDPPRPSTQLSTTGGEEAVKIAKARQTEIGSLASVLRRELEWIPLKALRKQRGERYDSALAMGEDIRRYLDGEPLEAGPESVVYRLKKTVRRNKGFVIAAAVIFAILIAGVVVSLSFAFYAEEQRARASQERTEAVQARDQSDIARKNASASSYRSSLSTSMASLNSIKLINSENLAEARAYLEHSREDLNRLSGPNNPIDHDLFLEQRILDRLMNRFIGEYYPTCWEAVVHASASLDGSKVAAQIYGHDENPDTILVLEFVDAVNLRLLRDEEPRDWWPPLDKHHLVPDREYTQIEDEGCLSFSHDGSKLFVGGEELRCWEIETGSLIWSVELNSPQVAVRSIATSPTGSLIATGCTNGEISLRHPVTGELLGELHGHELVPQLDFSSDGQRLVSGAHDGTLQVWDIAEKTKVYTIDAGAPITAVDFAPTDDLVAWSTSSPSEIGYGMPLDIEAADRSAVHIADALTGQEKVVLTGNRAITDSIKFRPTGDLLACTGRDRNTLLFDLDSYKIKEIFGHLVHDKRQNFMGPVCEPGPVIWTADGNALLTGDGTLWDVGQTRRFVVDSRKVGNPVFNHDETVLASSIGPGQVKLWDIETGVQLGVIDVGVSELDMYGGNGAYDRNVQELVSPIACNPIKDQIVVGIHNYGFVIVDAVTGAITHRCMPLNEGQESDGSEYPELIKHHPGDFYPAWSGDLFYSSDGSRIYSVSPKHRHVWDSVTGKELTTIGDYPITQDRLDDIRSGQTPRTFTIGSRTISDSSAGLRDFSFTIQNAKEQSELVKIPAEGVLSQISPTGKFLAFEKRSSWNDERDAELFVMEARSVEDAIESRLKRRELLADFEQDAKFIVASAGKDDGMLQSLLEEKRRELSSMEVSAFNALVFKLLNEAKAHNKSF